MKRIISPSILTADFGNLQRDVEMLNGSCSDWIHLDVMDGVFVPNISFGLPVVRAVSRLTVKPLDVHLMLADPGRYIEAFCKAGANILTVHIEACTHLHGVVQHIKSLGMKAGVALNPHTPVATVENIVNDVDLLLIMSVNPGFGGQRFIESSTAKVWQARELIRRANSTALIEVDGGIGVENAPLIFGAGADAAVSGNSIFSSTNPVKYIEELKHGKT
jgi:ribulose-phosphate 3-epimerase